MELIRNPKSLTPHVAIQTAASSAAHLTKYANITDLKTGQKKLIVDEAIVPSCPVFDYTVTYTAPPALTADGAMDGLSHILKVFYGAVGKPHYDKLTQIAQAGISLIVNYLPQGLRRGRPPCLPYESGQPQGMCLSSSEVAWASRPWIQDHGQDARATGGFARAIQRSRPPIPCGRLRPRPPL